jgi:hypothetical protein
MNAELRRTVGFGDGSADWKSAIRQVGNLRYDLRRDEDIAPYLHPDAA